MDTADPCHLLINHTHVGEFEVRLAVKISLTVLYGCILLAGLLGNSVTIRTTKVLRDKGYLQKGVTDHMISLACSDLLVLVLGMPVELYSLIWFPFSSGYGDAACKAYSFLFEACSYATIFHVATLSLERFVAICYPFRFKAVSGSRAAKLMIGCAWAASLCVALPLLFAMGAEYPLNPTQGHRRQRNCNRTGPYGPRPNVTLCTSLSNRWAVFQSSIFSGFIAYILVLGAVAFMCRRMMLAIMATKQPTVLVRGQNRTGVATEMAKSTSPQAKAARKQTIVFLGLIVGTLALCWMPNQVLRIMAASTPKYEWSIRYFRIYMTLLPVADIFFYLSSVVNPLLYNISSKQFRAVFLQVLRCRLTIQHVNKERLLKANQISAKNSTASKRPLILSSIRRSLSGRKTKGKTLGTFQAAAACTVPLCSHEAAAACTVPLSSHEAAACTVPLSSHEAAAACTVPLSSHEAAAACTVPLSSHEAATACTVPLSSHEAAAACTVPLSSHEAAAACTVPLSSHEAAAACTVLLSSHEAGEAGREPKGQRSGSKRWNGLCESEI